MFTKQKIEKFFQKVNKTESCWLWFGAIHKTGSGSFYVGENGKTNSPAHRFSYVLHFGEISADLFVKQICENKLCVNPEHLKLINRSETDNKPPTRKGIRWNEMRKSEWSKRQKGKIGHTHTRETRIKLSLQRQGANGSNWQGGKTDESKAARNTFEYKIWRTSVFNRDNFTCLKCNQKGGKLHPHHIFNFAEHKSLRYETSNGATLCVNCHKRFHALFGKKQNNRIQLNQFLEAQMAIVEAGQAVMEEVFMPYAVMPSTNKTMFQHFTENSQKLLGK